MQTKDITQEQIQSTITAIIDIIEEKLGTLSNESYSNLLEELNILLDKEFGYPEYASWN